MLDLHSQVPHLTIGAVQEKRVFPNHVAFLSRVISWELDSVEFKYEVRIDPDGMLRGSLGTRLGRIADRHNIRVSVHAPYDDGINLGATDPVLLQETKKRIKYSIEFAQRVNAKHLTVHGGFLELGEMHDNEEERGRPPYEIARRRAGGKAMAELKARIFEEVGWVMEYGAKRGIKVALENLHGFSRTRVRFPITPQDFAECREALGKLYIVYDTGHAHSTGLETNEFISKVGQEDIIGAHIHDNDGTADLHLAIGHGNIRFDQMLWDYVRFAWDFPLNIEVRSVEDFEESKRYFQKSSKLRLMKKTGTNK